MMKKFSSYFTVLSKELRTSLATAENVREEEKMNETAAAAKLLADSETAEKTFESSKRPKRQVFDSCD